MFKYMNYVPIVVATDLDVHFALEGGANTFVYIVYIQYDIQVIQCLVSRWIEITRDVSI